MQADAASSQLVVALLQRKVESLAAQKFTAFFAIMEHPVLRGGETEQARQVLRAFKTLQIYAGCAACVTHVYALGRRPSL